MTNYGNLFAEHEAQYKASVMYATWGHLDPSPETVYPVSFYVAKGDRDYCIFNQKSEPCGPGFSQDINEYCYKKLMCNDNKPEAVYYFEGTYQMYKKPVSQRRGTIGEDMYGYFKGQLKKVKLGVK